MKVGAVVVFKAPLPTHQRKSASTRPEPPPERIPGKWKAISGAPTGWWLVPNDHDARDWMVMHPDRVTSGCIQAPTAQLELSFIAEVRRNK